MVITQLYYLCFQFCAALRYLATGANYSTIADYQGISKATLSRAVHEVIRFLWSLTYEYIIWPYFPNQLGDKAREFYESTGKPCTVGCIDGTHIAIKKTPLEEEGEYINRKLYHSLNVMVMKILSSFYKKLSFFIFYLLNIDMCFFKNFFLNDDYIETFFVNQNLINCRLSVM